MGISHVTVVGAGLCGLTLAWKLQESGLQTLLLESQPQIGGLAKSISWQGYRFDLGPGYFYTEEEPSHTELLRLMKKVHEVRLRRHRIWYRERWIDYPLSAQSLRQIPTQALALAFGQYAALWGRKQFRWPLSKRKASSVSVPPYGELLDGILMEGYRSKIRRHPADSLRPQWAADSEAFSPSFELLQQALRGAFEATETHAKTFHDPDAGFGSLALALRREIERLGGQIKTRARVQRILAPNDEVQSVEFHFDGIEHQVETDYLLSTIPLPSLLTLLDPLPEHALIERSYRLRHHMMIFLCVLLRDAEGPSPEERDCLSYFPEASTPFFRVSYPQPEDETSTRRSCLLVEWMLSPHHPLAKAPAEELFQAAIPGLQAAGFGTEGVVDLQVHRENQAVPLFDQQAHGYMRQISGYLTRVRRLRSLGQRGTFAPSHLSHTLRDAFSAAEQLVQESQRIKGRVG